MDHGMDDLRRTISERVNGAVAGVSHAEAALAAASGRVAGALDAVAANAEAARATLESQREALITAIHSRFDALELMVDSSRRAKTAALEAELVAIDTQLERAQAVNGGARHAVTEMSDAELAMRHSALTSELDAIDECAHASHWPVEPDAIAVVALGPEVPRLIQRISCLGNVVAARAPQASDVVVTRNIPPRIPLGATASFAVALSEKFIADHSSWGYLPPSGVLGGDAVDFTPALRVCVSADVVPTSQSAAAAGGASSASPVLHQAVSFKGVSLASRGQLVTIGPLPSSFATEAALIVKATVAGCDIPGFPCRVLLDTGKATGIRALNTYRCLLKDGICISPVVTRSGMLWVPATGSAGGSHVVFAFDADGKEMPVLLDASHGGLSRYMRAVAYDDASATLFLADANGRASKLTALDPLTSAIRWETPAKALNVCGGVAALPSLGLIAVSSACSNRVHILRVTDGTPVAHFSCKVPGCLAAWADESGDATVFVSCQNRTATSYMVVAFRVPASLAAPGPPDASSVDGAPPAPMPPRDIPLEALGRPHVQSVVPCSPRVFLLTVVPQAAPQSFDSSAPRAHLVAGVLGASVFHAVALPFEHHADTGTRAGEPGAFMYTVHSAGAGVAVVGLAGDPAGGALVVCDSSLGGTIRVLPWPLSA